VLARFSSNSSLAALSALRLNTSIRSTVLPKTYSNFVNIISNTLTILPLHIRSASS
jgi:hypothetical protein